MPPPRPRSERRAARAVDGLPSRRRLEPARRPPPGRLFRLHRVRARQPADADHRPGPLAALPLRPTARAARGPAYIATRSGDSSSRSRCARATQFRPPPPARYPVTRVQDTGREILAWSAGADRRGEGHRGVLGRRAPNSELPPGHWAPLRPIRLPARRAHAGRGRRSCSSPSETPDRRGHRRLGREARLTTPSGPSPAIHFLYAGKRVRAWGGPYPGDAVIRGEDWRPYQPRTFITPPFPEYVSGHSAFCRGGRRGPKLVHGQRRVRLRRRHPARLVAGRARARRRRGDVTLALADFLRRRRRAGHLPALWRHPLRAGRPGRAAHSAARSAPRSGQRPSPSSTARRSTEGMDPTARGTPIAREAELLR